MNFTPTETRYTYTYGSSLVSLASATTLFIYARTHFRVSLVNLACSVAAAEFTADMASAESYEARRKARQAAARSK